MDAPLARARVTAAPPRQGARALLAMQQFVTGAHGCGGGLSFGDGGGVTSRLDCVRPPSGCDQGRHRCSPSARDVSQPRDRELPAAPRALLPRGEPGCPASMRSSQRSCRGDAQPPRRCRGRKRRMWRLVLLRARGRRCGARERSRVPIPCFPKTATPPPWFRPLPLLVHSRCLT